MNNGKDEIEDVICNIYVLTNLLLGAHVLHDKRELNPKDVNIEQLINNAKMCLDILLSRKMTQTNIDNCTVVSELLTVLEEKDRERDQYKLQKLLRED